jgi:hypothetical protein
MRDYIAANKYKLHHTFWCINIDSADTDGLFTRGEGTAFPGGRDLKWNDNKYDNYLYPVLWKNNEGKFIGLDHKVPLGNNGISLSDYNDTNTGEPSNSPSPTPTKSTPPSTSPSLTPTPVEVVEDVNKDGAINITDIMLIAGAFNSVKGDSKYNPLMDLNKDNAVNISDIMICAAKFNTQVK